MKRIILLITIMFSLIGCLRFQTTLHDNEEVQRNFELAMKQNQRMSDIALSKDIQSQSPTKWGKVKLIWVREDLRLVYIYLNKNGVYYPIVLPMDDEFGKPIQ